MNISTGYYIIDGITYKAGEEPPEVQEKIASQERGLWPDEYYEEYRLWLLAGLEELGLEPRQVMLQEQWHERIGD